MKGTLHRLLAIRTLLEDLAHLEFEKRAAEIRRLETAAEREGRLALAARADALRLLVEPASSAEAWLVGIADADLLAWKRGALTALARAGRPALERARADLFTRRLERRQVEIIAAAAAEAEKHEQMRRDQKRVDDWFQSRKSSRST
jgi:flagellar export protein FliJ